MKILITLSLILFSFQVGAGEYFQADCHLTIKIYREFAKNYVPGRVWYEDQIKYYEKYGRCKIYGEYGNTQGGIDYWVKKAERDNNPELVRLLKQIPENHRRRKAAEAKKAEAKREAKAKREEAKRKSEAARKEMEAAQKAALRDPFSGQYDPFYVLKKLTGDTIQEKDKCPTLKREMKFYQRYESQGFRVNTRSPTNYYFTRADITIQKKKQYKPILLANIRIHCGSAVADGFAAISNAIAGNTPTSTQRAVSGSGGNTAIENRFKALENEIKTLKNKVNTCGCQARQAGNR